uniref:RNA-directed DNA polymerase n=1 Tax=Panagrolaimus davidi TaxID=227884 RepID=A0A914PVH5_9BILA
MAICALIFVPMVQAIEDLESLPMLKTCLPEHSGKTFFIERPQHRQCDITAKFVNRGTAKIFVPNTTPLVLNIQECYAIKFETDIVKMFGLTFSEKNLTVAFVKLSAKDCNRMYEDHEIHGFTLKNYGYGKYQTTNKAKSNHSFGRQVDTVTNYFLHTAAVAIIDNGALMETPLADMRKCVATENFCQVGNKTLVWNYPKTPPCPYLEVGIFPAMEDAVYKVIVPELQAVFTPLGKPIPENAQKCVPAGATLMANDVILEFESANSTVKTRVKRQKKSQRVPSNEEDGGPRKSVRTDQSDSTTTSTTPPTTTETTESTTTTSTVPTSTSAASTTTSTDKTKSTNPTKPKQTISSSTSTATTKPAKTTSTSTTTTTTKPAETTSTSTTTKTTTTEMAQTTSTTTTTTTAEPTTPASSSTTSTTTTPIPTTETTTTTTTTPQSTSSTTSTSTTSTVSVASDATTESPTTPVPKKSQKVNSDDATVNKSQQAEKHEDTTTAIPQQQFPLFPHVLEKLRNRTRRDNFSNPTSIQQVQFNAVIKLFHKYGLKLTLESLPIAQAMISATGEDFDITGIEHAEKDQQVNNAFNTRIMYALYLEQQRNDIDFHMLFKQICLMTNKDVDTVLALYEIDPTAATRKWLQNNGVTAKFQGDVIQVTACRKIQPDYIHWDGQKDGTCYKYPPVVVKGYNYFYNYERQEITRESEKVNCENRPKMIRKTKDGKYVYNKQEIEVIKNDETPLTFTGAELKEQLTAENFFQSDMNKVLTRTSLLQRYLNRMNDIVIMEPEPTNQTDSIWDAVIALGAMSDVIGEAADKFMETYDGFVLDPIGYIKRLFLKYYPIALTIILGIIFVMILSITHPFWIPLLLLCTRKMGNVVKFRRRKRSTSQKVLALRGENIPLRAPMIHDFVPPVFSVKTDNKAPEPVIMIEINGKPVQAIIDTGSTITYCAHSIAQELQLKMRPPKIPAARTVNNETFPFNGEATIQMKIGNSNKNVTILSSEDANCPSECLIGTDVLRHFPPLTLDFKNNRVTCNATTLPTMAYVTSPSVISNYDIVATEDVELQPRSETVFTARILEAQKGETFITLHTNERLPTETKMAKSVVVTQKQAQIPVRFINAGNAKILIRKNQKCGRAEKLDLESTVIKQVYQVKPSTYIPPEVDVAEKLLPNPNEPKTTDDLKFNLDDAFLSPEAKIKLLKVLKSHPKAFVGPDGVIGHYNGPIKHRIDLIPGAQPIRRRPYPIPLAQQQIVKQMIDEMLKQKIIQPSTSPFASPIILVKKQDGTTRLAVDYRALNNITLKSNYVLPKVTDIVNLVGGKKLFSVWDFASGFWQVDVEPSHRERTAFTCFLGLFEFIRLPFGLCGAPFEFQRIMESFKRLISSAFFIYIDDVILASNSEEEHIRDIDQFLSVIEASGMKLKASKCHIAQRQIKYLGYIISEEGIKPDPKSVEAIKTLSQPKTLTALRSLLGALSYWRKFIVGFAKIAEPLYELTKKDASVSSWNKKHDEALQTLKEKLMSAPVLAAPRLNCPYIIETDASAHAISAVLLQEHEDGEHPIAFASRTLNKHERNYNALETEALAICYSIEQFKCYLEGAGRSLLRTDNAALTSLLRKKDLTGRLARYQLTIQDADINIVHRPGRSNHYCDHSSRFFQPEVPQVSAVIPTPTVDKDKIQQAQAEDREVQMLKAAKLGTMPTDEAEKRKAKLYLPKIKVEGDLLFFVGKSRRQKKIWIPVKLRHEIFLDFHGNPLQGAHLGVDRTINLLKPRAYWPSMPRDVAQFIAQCPTCQKLKVQAGDRKTPESISLEPATRPFERCHTDICGPFPTSERNNRYILATTDAFSKWLICTAMPNQTAESVTKAFLDDVIAKHGIPERLISDNGKQFVGKIFKDMLNWANVKHRTITPYNPQANGAIERMNRTVEVMLTAFVNEAGTDWDQYLQLVVFSYNNSCHEVTKLTPFQLLYLRSPKLPSDITLDHFTTSEVDIYGTIFMERTAVAAKAAWKLVNEKLNANARQQASKTDRIRKAAPRDFQPGDLVLKIQDYVPGGANKFSHKWIGPFKIVAIRRLNVQIETSPNQTIWTHKNKLKLYR